MKIVFALLLMLSVTLSAQTSKQPSKSELTKIYVQAIGDFIKTANQKNGTSFDTLFFGKGLAGQPGLFPDIQLPTIIENTRVLLVTPETATKIQKEKKSRVYVNLPGWVTKEKAEFIFVVFSNGFEHQYDYYINYKYNAKQKAFEQEKLEFKSAPFEK